MTRRQYKQPPVTEAICEFRFVGKPNEDFGAAAAFYSEIKADYPGQPESPHRAAIGNPLALNKGEMLIAIPQVVGAINVLFRNVERTRLVGLGQNVVSVHMLRPYTNWEEFEARIQKTFEAYCRTFGPLGVTRIGVRYTNHIPMGEKSAVEFLSEFALAPQTAIARLLGFFVRAECNLPNHDGQAVVMIATGHKADDARKKDLLLDLDVSQEWTSEQPLALDVALTKAKQFREVERDLFERYITDCARGVFDA